MSSETVAVALSREQFTESEKVVARYEGLTASTFLYPRGVAGLRIANGVGHVDLLPFHGQQIWDAVFHGRSLTMKSMFDGPRPTQDYLRNYGAFFLHCGVTAMGNPGPGDTQPLHGELPNATYDTAELLIGRDAEGPFMALSGTYRHTVAFACNYVARPTLKVSEGSSRLAMELSVRNLRHAPMELMYLAHINFRPVDGGRLIDAVPDDAAHMALRTELPAGFVPSAGHARLLEELARDLGSHRVLVPGRMIDPELVVALTYPADGDGWAHSMQLHPDGSADFVSHRPGELPFGVRWISRSADQDALGLVLPATAAADGYTAEKAKGRLVLVPPEGEFRCAFAFGSLEAAEATRLRSGIEVVRAG